MKNINVIVTGAAGFIGMHSAIKILENGFNVLGIDNINEYYDPKLKLARLEILNRYKNFSFEKLDISNFEAIKQIFSNFKPDIVIHLAAQAGVRYSINHPDVYLNTNLLGFLNILECCRYSNVEHLMYASSSSVYGLTDSDIFTEDQSTDRPVSFYAATKKSNELMAHCYSHLFNLRCTGLRFFTVYGPWGRPDMSLFKFTDAILNNKPIDVYNNGKMKRDFTFIDDVYSIIVKILLKNLYDNSYTELNNIFNVGNSSPVMLNDFIASLENVLNKKAIKNYLPLQDGDVINTYADTKKLEKFIGFSPNYELNRGIEEFVIWYKSYY